MSELTKRLRYTPTNDPTPSIAADRIELIEQLFSEVCETWVNGRRVLDGIPQTLARKVKALRLLDAAQEKGW